MTIDTNTIQFIQDLFQIVIGAVQDRNIFQILIGAVQNGGICQILIALFKMGYPIT